MSSVSREKAEAREDLLARYEVLRASALAVPAKKSRELELFVRSGTVAWIKAWSMLTAPPVSRREGRVGSAARAAFSELAPVLADLALSAARG